MTAASKHCVVPPRARPDLIEELRESAERPLHEHLRRTV